MVGVGTAQTSGMRATAALRRYHTDAAIPGELQICASSAPSIIVTGLIELCLPVVPWFETEHETRKPGLARKHTPLPLIS